MFERRRGFARSPQLLKHDARVGRSLRVVRPQPQGLDVGFDRLGKAALLLQHAAAIEVRLRIRRIERQCLIEGRTRFIESVLRSA